MTHADGRKLYSHEWAVANRTFNELYRDAALLETQVEQLQGELQFEKSVSKGQADAAILSLKRAEQAEAQIADMERVNNDVRHEMKQAEQERDSALRGEKFQRELQESRLRDLLKAEARVKELEQERDTLIEDKTFFVTKSEQHKAHLATATARCKWLEEGTRLWQRGYSGADNSGEYQRWRAAEPQDK